MSAQWWRNATIYQIYPRSFADSDGDGVGDLQGVIDHLDHLAGLGVDAVWLSPFYPSPGADNGYDVSDYCAVDPLFGDLETFDRLVAEAHARGVRVIVDIVPNHTSDEHDWFAESRASSRSAKRDWYVWRPPRPGTTAGDPGAEPTNWRSFFGPQSWTLDPTTEEYYLHLFDAKQPDLNWENPQVRRALADVMAWWLDRGVDGLRLDVFNLVSKDPALPDGVGGDGFPHWADGPRLDEYAAELRERLAAPGRDLVLIGETPGVSIDQAVRLTDPRRAELDMVFTFKHVSLDHGADKFDVRPLGPDALPDCLAVLQEGLGERGWMGLYLGNHDQPRPVSRFGDDSPAWRAASAKTLAVMALLHRGTAFVYQGEELGLRNAGFADASQLRDVESLNALAAGRDFGGIAAMGRDNARTPMRWDESCHAGFTTGRPWIDAPDDPGWSVASESDDPDSVLALYRRLIALRRTHPAVPAGGYRRLATGVPGAYAYLREAGEASLLVVANLTTRDASLELAEAAGRAALLATGPHSLDGARLDLPGWTAVVLG